MKNFVSKWIPFSGMLLGLPLLGVYLKGAPIGNYLEFPPRTHYATHAPFSWSAFVAYSFLIVLTTAPLGWRLFHAQKEKTGSPPKRCPFPWWGWAGLAAGSVSWILAWNRFAWFAPFQAYTFTPLWLSFILVVNAVGYKMRGQCLLVNHTRFFLLLFPVSSLFWWYFEYLNRFVQNWHYQVPRYDALQYFLSSTLPFSTVLPAVLSVRECLIGWERLQQAYANFLPLRPSHPKALAAIVLAGAGMILTGVGVYPDYFFSFLWVSPFLIMVCLQTLAGERHILSGIAEGDWRLGMASVMAGLICGGFWEMWNYYSLARWEYTIPFVQRFELFEMPLLGYAGYLPFGLECAAVENLMRSAERS
ncbi:hypothetical protein [Desulforhabdus amnigena]|uniref:Small-conductance mechanosensitive channel n=1 Tax=Desulforhabdus amnigena TaxID=40218 RepID=A0A9W6FWN3_9BACT|nr:hypothetical protein [Desulforhabdus amnigena]NLJ28568.1 hypothetical protein [Deltaproteobacteria bacterium]GLI36319.1 hypothetical protein DAMNIGENAA_37520 [Desulforhabdus amnigena]